ncbi:MAG: hypothetical protein ACREIA_21625 [Opitutaceae bacterium]
MVSLDIAVVVGSRNVRRVQVNEIGAWLSAEYIPIDCAIVPSIVEDRPVVCFNLLDEMLFERELKIASPVVVILLVSRNGENPARLPLDAATEQGRKGQRSFCRRCQAPDPFPCVVEKSQLARRVENVFEG